MSRKSAKRKHPKPFSNTLKGFVFFILTHPDAKLLKSFAGDA